MLQHIVDIDVFIAFLPLLPPPHSAEKLKKISTSAEFSVIIIYS